MNLTIDLPFTLFGQDFNAEVEVDITYLGHIPDATDPGSGPEWTLENVTLTKEGFNISSSPWLEKIIDESSVLAEAICEAIHNGELT